MSSATDCSNCGHYYDPVAFRWKCPACGNKDTCCEGEAQCQTDSQVGSETIRGRGKSRMSDPASKSPITPELLEAGRKLGQALVGGLKVMSEVLDSSMSANSRTNGATPSSSPSGSRSAPKPSEMDESPEWSSSSETAPSSTSSSLSEAGQEILRKFRIKEDREVMPLFECDREGTLILHFSMYGTEEQKRKKVEDMLRNLSVKGYDFIQVMLDVEEINR